MPYVNEPQLLEREVYTQAQTAFLSTVAQFPDIVSVYSAGTISQPGISDLDFVLCLKDRPTVPLNLDIEARLPTEVGDLIGSGTILKLPESYFADIHLIDQLPLTPLLGKQYAIKHYDSLWFKLCRIMDWLPERLCTLQKIQQTSAEGGDINVTRALQVLKSVTISLNLLETLVPDAATADWVTQVKQLRDHWFTNKNRLADFTTVLRASAPLLQNAIWRLHDYIAEQEYMRELAVPFMPESQLVIPHGPSFRFSNSREGDSSKVILPLSFAYFLAAQAGGGDSWLCQQLRASFKPAAPAKDYSGVITADWGNVIRQRIDYVSAVADYFKRVGLTSGLLKYGWYLK